MDWIAALALSLPIAVAVAWSANVRAKASRARDRALKSAAASAANAADRASDASTANAELAAEAVRWSADQARFAVIRAAKYQSGAVRVNPRPEPDAPKTPLEKWLATEGRFKPPEVQAAVEAAFAYVAGDDDGSEMGELGTPQGAKSIIEEHAGSAWYAAAVEHAKRGR